MRSAMIAAAFLLALAPAGLRAQSVEKTSSMHDRLMPPAAALPLVAPAAESSAESKPVAQPMASRGAGMPYMIAGAALFVAGLIAGGDGGTVLILAGAGIGAYGLYLHFR